MYEFQGVLRNCDRAVFFKKAVLRGGRFLYAFRDAHQAELEERSFAEHAKQHEFDGAANLRKKAAFGTIVFESDQDLDSEVVYRCYEDRWQIELIFRRYKNDACLDQTGVQGDFSVIGSAFINFISTTLTCRMLTFGDVVERVVAAIGRIRESSLNRPPCAREAQFGTRSSVRTLPS